MIILFFHLMVKPNTCDIVYLFSSLKFSHASLNTYVLFLPQKDLQEEHVRKGNCKLKSINSTCFMTAVISTPFSK